MSNALKRAGHALQASIRRDGYTGTLRKIPKLARFLATRLSSNDYYRRYRQLEAEDGFDAKYGTDTSALVETFELGLAGPNRAFAVRYEPALVRDVRRALDALPIRHADFTFVDIGSGKGRTLMLAAAYGYKKLVGVELSRDLLSTARQNLERFVENGGPRADFELLHADAAAFEPPPGDLVYYLFNPFGAPVLTVVIENLVRSLAASPRKAWIIYVCPNHAEVVERTGAFERRHEDERFLVFSN